MTYEIYNFGTPVYGHALVQEPCPRDHEINNFGRPFLGHHYYILLFDQCLKGEKKIFKEIQQFYTFYFKITSPLDGGHEIYNFLILQMLHTFA